MNYEKILFILTIFVFIALSCTRGEAPSPDLREPGLTTVKKEVATAREPWEDKWQKTLQEARKEGRVVVYGGSTAAALKTHATKIIKEKFGLDLEALSGRGGELTARMRSERANSLFVVDIYASGVSTIYDTFKPWGAVEPLEPVLILPEVLDPKLWFDGKLPWGDEERKAIIWAGHPNPALAINSSIVQTEEIKSYLDLLDPKWKGKIAINDPTVGEGAGSTGFNALLYNKAVDLDFFRQLAERQQVTVLRDQHLQITWLARGKSPVALWPSGGRMAEYKDAGAPIKYVIPKEGIYLSGGGGALALMNKAPHTNAATILLNWLLSKEGQLLLQNSVDKQTRRIDLPVTDVDPARTRQPGVKYLVDPNIIEKWILHEKDKYMQMAMEIFGPLIGK